MLEIGRVCVKIAGRMAGKYCVVLDNVDKNFVLVDGQVKRKRCNIEHLEPTKDVVKIKKGASHAEVAKALEKLKIKVTVTKPRTKKAEKPIKIRKKKEKPVKEKKESKAKKSAKAEKKAKKK